MQLNKYEEGSILNSSDATVATLRPKRAMTPIGPNTAFKKINDNQWYLVLLVN